MQKNPFNDYYHEKHIMQLLSGECSKNSGLEFLGISTVFPILINHNVVGLLHFYKEFARYLAQFIGVS